MSDTMDAIGLTKRPPTNEEIESASEAAIAFATAMEMDKSLNITGPNSEPLRISPAIGELVVDLLGHVAKGDMVTLVPTGAMLTTQDAALMLNVSRPFLSKLLKTGKIEHTLVGTHRRVTLSALLRYKTEQDIKQKDALNLIADLGQEFDAKW